MPTSWPEAPRQSRRAQEPPAWPDPPVKDPVPAWEEPKPSAPPSWPQTEQPAWPQADQPSWQQPEKPSWQQAEQQPSWQQPEQPARPQAEQPAWPQADQPAWQQAEQPAWPQHDQPAWPQNEQTAWQQNEQPSWPQADPLGPPSTGPQPQAGPPPWSQSDPLSGPHPQSAPPAWPQADPLSGPHPQSSPQPGSFSDPLSGPYPPQSDPLSGPMQGAHAAPPQWDAAESTQVHPQQPGADQQHPDDKLAYSPEDRPGSNLSRDPSDPDHRFVTAGQISGSRTPPPERQQELWNTVFGDNYQAMGDGESLDDDDGPSKPIWIYALAGSVAIALVGALLWAFLAGPLAGDEPEQSAAPSPTAAAPTKAPTKQPVKVAPLPKFPGKAAAVVGTISDSQAKLTVPQLGGTWQLDRRGMVTVKANFGYDTRQFARTTTPNVFAQVLTGPLSDKLTASYTDPNNLEPVIKQVVVNARKTFFETPNTARKLGQQTLKVGKGRAISYEITQGDTKTVVTVAAVNTGADVPSIVYMSVPRTSAALLPDINTVVRNLKVVS